MILIYQTGFLIFIQVLLDYQKLQMFAHRTFLKMLGMAFDFDHDILIVNFDFIEANCRNL